MNSNNIQLQDKLVLSNYDKESVEKFLQKASKEDPNKIDDAMRNFGAQQHPSWRRYIDGVYSHPLTWWTGIIQIQMVMGLWGPTFTIRTTKTQRCQVVKKSLEA